MLTLANRFLTAAVDPRGAELASLLTADGRQWLWQGDPAFWSGRAPVLFPVIGRSPGGICSICGAPYRMPSHGFARDMVFSIMAHSAIGCRLRLTDTAETRACYPFSFALDLDYRLHDATLEITAEVTNSGDDRLPYAIGFHPAFNWPLPGGCEQVHRIVLADRAEVLVRGIGAQGLVLPDDGSGVPMDVAMLLDRGILDRGAVVIVGGWDGHAVFATAAGTGVRLEAERLPFLALWSPPKAPFLCIEPWSGLPAVAGGSDAIEDRPGINWLEPGRRGTATVRISPFLGPREQKPDAGT